PALAEHLRGFDAGRLVRITPDANLRLTILLHGLRGNKNRLKHFKMDNKSIALILTLLDEIETPAADDYTHIRQRLAKTSPEIFRLLARLFEAYGADMSGVYAKLETILEEGHCISLRTLAIGGDDLKQLGITDGRAIGRTLEALLGHVLETPEDNTFEVLKKLVVSI
ncbi:MAG: hypothetical protein FWE68_06255, partial [Defluviitaleaceae bacterium]|nr:hypothetical protein [Defluviitaleaceae bacterium]